MYFRSFIIISPWKKACMALHMNKLESPSPKDALCQGWLKLAQCFWRRFLIFRQSIFAISLYKFEFSITQRGFFPCLVEIGTVVMEKMKMWKVNDNYNDDKDDNNNDNGQRTNCDQKRSLKKLKRNKMKYINTWFKHGTSKPLWNRMAIIARPLFLCLYFLQIKIMTLK